MTDPASDNSGDERISGVVLRTTYHNSENDYRVVKLQPMGEIDARRLDKRREIVMVGSFPSIEAGECIEAEGRWSSHPKHGPQFRARWFKPTLPSTTRGIETYLASGVLKGVGPVFAKRIVDAFGPDTFDVLDGEIDRLSRVPGITRAKLESIRRSWSEARGDRELITFLGDHGITPVWASRLRKVYGEAALSIIRSNPYRLAAEVRGVGFARADVMARRIGIAADAPERIDAALAHVLERQSEEGHTFLPRGALLELAVKLLDLDEAAVEERLKVMIQQERVATETFLGEQVIFLTTLHEAERECAADLLRLAAAERRVPRIDTESALTAFERRFKFDLSPAQRAGVLRICREGMMVLTGGPGTGKTTTLRAVIHLYHEAGLKVRLAAPTGRAARRLSETSKMLAETIHRLLSFQPHKRRFQFDRMNPLDADLVVIDEVSMLDVTLSRDLLSALSSGTCLLLVGDEDQLPSVGAGNVLRDVSASGLVPLVRLTEIFRQAQQSLIVLNAHRINHGEPPLFAPPEGMTEPDFFFIEREDPADVAATIRTLVAERIPDKYRLDPIRDVQVLTPMRRGALGVHEINRVLQAALNPPTGEQKGATDEFAEMPDPGTDGVRERPPTLRPGDRVMQTSNDYERDVFNGDIGRIHSVNAESREVLVDFDGRQVLYTDEQTRQLTLAYAVTIHKSQGSEYRAVVIPIHTSHFIMLKRNLLYTAMTRGRDLVCIVGTKRALWRAIRDDTRLSRNSALEYFIRNPPEGF